MLARGEVKTQTELAWLMGVTPARVTQIMKLLDLAPEIQSLVLTAQSSFRHESSLLQAAKKKAWRAQLDELGELRRECRRVRGEAEII